MRSFFKNPYANVPTMLSSGTLSHGMSETVRGSSFECGTGVLFSFASLCVCVVLDPLDE